MLSKLSLIISMPASIILELKWGREKKKKRQRRLKSYEKKGKDKHGTHNIRRPQSISSRFYEIPSDGRSKGNSHYTPLHHFLCHRSLFFFFFFPLLKEPAPATPIIVSPRARKTLLSTSVFFPHSLLFVHF